MTISTRISRPQAFAIAGLILAVAAYRVVSASVWPDLPNFSPVMALAFCGGLFLPGLAAWIVPVAAVLLSDIALSLLKQYPVSGAWQAVTLLCVLAAVAAGRWLGRRETFGLGSYVGLLLAGGIGFYLAANSLAWVMEPLYPRSIAGFVQAQTTGLPGYLPAWMFLRNALVSDLLFGGMILAVRLAARSSEFPKALDGEMRNGAECAVVVEQSKVA